MTLLTAGAALHPLVLPVSVEQRPPFDVTALRARDVVFAVHANGAEADPRAFLGLVGWNMIGRFPGRIFGDLLPDPCPCPVSVDCPLDEVLEQFEREGQGALPVVDDSGFQGAVTRASVAEALLSEGLDRATPRAAAWTRMLRRLHALESHALRVDALTHDLANALHSVGVLAADLGARGSAKESEWLSHAAEHAISLLGRLREEGQDDFFPELAPGAELLEGLVRQTRLGLRGSIDVYAQLGSPEPSLCVDRTDLERIVANLVTNACDAMPGGGSLRLTVDYVELGAEELDVFGRPIARGPWARVQIDDSGHGMDPSMLRSVFQPQFSTRAAHGRGLGLSSVQRLVRRNGGAISCRTGVGAGTTFTLYFKGSRGPQSG